MYAVTSIWLLSFTRATLRSAEFGFLGVVVYTRVHTPRRCGLPLSAAVLVFATLSWRPLRTNCWMVGMDQLSSSSAVVLCCLVLSSLSGALVRSVSADRRPARPPAPYPEVGRVAAGRLSTGEYGPG